MIAVWSFDLREKVDVLQNNNRFFFMRRNGRELGDAIFDDLPEETTLKNLAVAMLDFIEEIDE